MENKELIRYLIKHHNMKRLKYKGKLTPEQEKKYDEIMSGLQSIKKDIEKIEKYEKMINSLTAYTRAFKVKDRLCFEIEMWDDFEGFEDVAEWAESVYKKDNENKEIAKNGTERKS